MAEVDGYRSFPSIILSPKQFSMLKIFREKDTNINILNARCFIDRVFAVCCQTKFMFVFAWHLYSLELLIFYLLHPFCSSKPDYNCVIGCCSRPGIHKQCCLHSQDQIPCVWTLLGHWESKAPASAVWVHRSQCVHDKEQLSFTDRVQWFFYLNKLSFLVFSFFFYTHQSILDLCPTSPVWFPLIRGIPHMLFLAGLGLFFVSSWFMCLCDFYLFLWKQKAFVFPCIILAWKPLCCSGSDCTALFTLWYSALFTILSKLSTLQFSRSSPISTNVEAIPKRSIFA